MKNFRIFGPIVILIIATLACSSSGSVWSELTETGTIVFVDSEGKTLMHMDNTGIPQPISVNIESSFDDSKNINLSTRPEGFFWSCTVTKGVTPCPGGFILTPGEHTIHAETFKRDGSVVAIDTKVVWTPWSPVEKGLAGIGRLVGREDPLIGFNMVACLFSVILAFILSMKLGKEGAIAAFLVLLFGFLYVSPEAIQAQVISGVYGIAIGLILFYFFKSLHFGFVKKGDFVAGYVGPGGEGGAQVLNGLKGVTQSALEGDRQSHGQLKSGYYEEPLQITSGQQAEKSGRRGNRP